MSQESQYAYALIKELFLLVDDGDRRLLAEFGLTVPRYYTLIHIRGNSGLAPVQLSELMLCDKSNITRLVKGLEIDGLVNRVPHEEDGRSVRLYLSEKGRKLCDEAENMHLSFNRERFSFLDEASRTVLDSLQELHTRLSERLG